MDFATDEVVIGVGSRAKNIAEAEENWVDVLLKKDVRFGRVDENQGPIGYRCLLVWKLQEMYTNMEIYDQLVEKCDTVVDHVTRLTPLLKNGELDYAFVYKSYLCRSGYQIHITFKHDKSRESRFGLF